MLKHPINHVIEAARHLVCCINKFSATLSGGASVRKKLNKFNFFTHMLAGAVRVELTSTVLETAILTVVLRPYHYYFIILITSIKYFLLGFVIISPLTSRRSEERHRRHEGRDPEGGHWSYRSAGRMQTYRSKRYATSSSRLTPHCSASL